MLLNKESVSMLSTSLIWHNTKMANKYHKCSESVQAKSHFNNVLSRLGVDFVFESVKIIKDNTKYWELWERQINITNVQSQSTPRATSIRVLPSLALPSRLYHLNDHVMYWKTADYQGITLRWNKILYNYFTQHIYIL